jgi:hypothetical protein
MSRLLLRRVRLKAGVQNGHAGAGDASAYFVDTMLRSTNSADGDKADPSAEATRILVRSALILSSTS